MLRASHARRGKSTISHLPPIRAALTPLLEAAGQAALRHFRRASPTLKGDGSEVTEADRVAHDVLVEGLTRLWPRHAVVSEEGSGAEGAAGTWYVDPVDGTSAFVEGLAHWGPTVCLVEDSRLVLGALYLPRLGELWYAERGAGAWLGQERLRASSEPLTHHSSLYVPSRFHRYGPLDWPGKVRALGSTAAHLAQVAGGGAAATVVPRWNLWDIGCGILLVEEAGLTVRGLTGEPFDPMQDTDRPFVAGSAEALRCLVHEAPPLAPAAPTPPG